MVGRRLTRRELEETLDSMTGAMDSMTKNMAIMKSNYDALLLKYKAQNPKLAYYENPNFPPSASFGMEKTQTGKEKR